MGILQRQEKSLQFVNDREIKMADPLIQLDIHPSMRMYMTPGPLPSCGGNPDAINMQQTVIKI